MKCECIHEYCDQCSGAIVDKSVAEDLRARVSVLEAELKEAHDWQEQKRWRERQRFAESIDWGRMVSAQDVWDTMTTFRVKEDDARNIILNLARKP